MKPIIISDAVRRDPFLATGVERANRILLETSTGEADELVQPEWTLIGESNGRRSALLQLADETVKASRSFSADE